MDVEKRPKRTKSSNDLTSRFKQVGRLFFKVSLVGAIFYFLWSRGLFSFEAVYSALSKPKELLPPVLVIFSLTALGTLRWQILLGAQGMQVGYLRALQVNLIGTFFNTALPGAVSGDFVKAFYIARDFPGRRGNAFGSILFDRILGLCALVLVATGAVWAQWSSIRESSTLPIIRLTLTFGASGVILFFLYLFLMPRRIDPIERTLVRLAQWKPFAASLLHIFEGVRAYQQNRLQVLAALTLSLIIHLGVSWSSTQFLIALGDGHIQSSLLYVFVPLSLLVTAVPLLPGGIGTGHAALAWGLHSMGSNRGADVFTLFFLTNLAISFVGSFVYLAHPKSTRVPLEPAEEN